ncbi:16S rRNA (adenine(1518)-N(6)/adenine(1519)-N(6))-dimethyltransferase RsmA [Helicobacter sp. MIT 05-5293]|uniref:16S rRNA (adenine(1518)-N(6)/adenine(1519)-N(6))- dimethyltransferase RsmA n=1 Tax=Helicobacter sp. MIT 05-5293 TaxID=1548149 RepID=UPI000AD3A2EF|nr:16S rRNA (adenine(1518)-N(6)/adenine(1519)-N(6))-dimethyltransferase RsmA [Helicobacter sp. MIT 05-5293]
MLIKTKYLHTLGIMILKVFKGLNIVENYRAKKHFGQNFLKDSTFIQKIIQSIPTDKIPCVEIGVGLGDLTQELLKIEPLIAYEVDKDLCSLLKKKFANEISSGHLILNHQDILQMPSQQAWLHCDTYKVVSNLPYYIATHIILRLLRDKFCHSFLVMTQKEVAIKFCAKNTMREFCALSVLVESFGEAEILFDIPKEAFSPAPKVTSSVFIMRKTHCSQWEQDFSLATLEDFLKLAFSAPRKKLFSNLCHNFDANILKEAFDTIGISINARAHEVKTESFHHILKFLIERNNNGRAKQLYTKP